MKTVRLIFLVIFSTALLLLIVQNTDPVQANFLWISREVSAIVLLLVTATAAFVSGLMVALLTRRRPKEKKAAKA